MSSLFRRFAIKSVSTVAVAMLALTTSAQAQTFVGSWDVFNALAPSWTCCAPDGPLAYTGQEAAAFLFGGIPDDYIISTVGPDVDDINFSAWYDVIGVAGGRVFAQDYDNKYLGEFYGPTAGYAPGNENNAASAFVRDNLQGLDRINYAFRVSTVVPEPSTVVLSGFGLLALAATARRRRTQA